MTVLSLNTKRCMRHNPQTLLRDQLTGFSTDTIGFIFDAHQSCLQMLNKFQLALSQTARLLFGQRKRTLLSTLKVGEVSSISLLDV